MKSFESFLREKYPHELRIYKNEVILDLAEEWHASQIPSVEEIRKVIPQNTINGQEIARAVVEKMRGESNE